MKRPDGASECWNCNHYMPFVDGKEKLIREECRRFPPQIVITHTEMKGAITSIRSCFPEAIDRCGEYKAVKP